MITLNKMNETYYYSVYETYCINELSKQCVENGVWKKEEALQKACDEQKTVLPKGTQTEGQYLFTIFDSLDQIDIGEIWIGEIENESREMCFLFDIHINEAFQNKGYGKKAIFELEKKAKEIGFKKIRLHVFTNNEQAKEVYKKTGFHEYQRRDNSIWMEKEIAVQS